LTGLQYCFGTDGWLEASRQYQNNIEVLSTVRALMMRTISMGK